MESKDQKIEMIEKHIQEFLDDLKPEQDSYEAAVQALQHLMPHLIDENEQAQRIHFLQTAFGQLVEKFAAILSPAEKVQVNLWLGHQLEQMGAWDEALNIFLSVVNECGEEDALAHQKAEALRWVGHIQVMKNNWDEASQYYQQSLSCSLEHNDREGEAHARNALGYFFFEKGKFQDASLEWHNAIELAEKLDIPKLMASFYTNLGTLSVVQGEWEKALAYYGESIPRFEQVGQQRSLAETYHNMAMTYADVERWADAGNYYEKSNELAKQIGDIRLQAMVKLNRVRLYLAINDLLYAKAFCQQALRVFQNLEDHLGEADAYKYFGIIDTHKEKWDTAEDFFRQSIELNKKYQHPLGQAEAHVEFGHMYRQKQDVEHARQQYNFSLKIYRDLDLSKEVEKIENILSSL